MSTDLDPCRACDGTRLEPYLDFGPQPISTRLMSRADDVPRRYSSGLIHCADCGHVQRTCIVPASELYEQYGRLRSVGVPDYVDRLAQTVADIASHVVVEIGSNVGDFLKAVMRHGGPQVVGVEPAENCVEFSKGQGIPTIRGYFDPTVSTLVRERVGQPDVIVARHVLEHVDDIDGFLNCVSELLDPDGTFIVEVPDFAWSVKRGDFVSFTEEHISYFNHHSLRVLLRRHGFHVEICEIVPDNWSDAFLMICRRGKGVAERTGVVSLVSRDGFTASMEETRLQLSGLPRGSALFGGFCRSANLVNFLGLGDRGTFAYAIDDQEEKHGKYLPGSALQIVGSDRLYDVEFCVLGTLNHEDRVMQNHGDFIDRGGRFIRLFPWR